SPKHTAAHEAMVCSTMPSAAGSPPFTMTHLSLYRVAAIARNTFMLPCEGIFMQVIVARECIDELLKSSFAIGAAPTIGTPRYKSALFTDVARLNLSSLRLIVAT